MRKNENSYKGNNTIPKMNMELQYDKEVDVLDIKLKEGTYHKSKNIDGLTIIDYDKEGNVLRIEILDFSKRQKVTLPKIKELILA